MKKDMVLAGLDAGHVATKAVLLRGGEIVGFATAPTALDPTGAAEKALDQALRGARVTRNEVAAIAATGIYRELLKHPPLSVTATVPDYQAGAKGALFLSKNSRTLIYLGGNVQMVIRYDEEGNLIDAIQNDKCADGLGIFYTSMAGILGVNEEELSDLALRSAGNLHVSIHCAASAESEAIDLICQDANRPDVADAILRFIVERVTAMCNSIALVDEVAIAGGMAKSRALTKHLHEMLRKDLVVLTPPEYVGAIGAAMSIEGER